MNTALRTAGILAVCAALVWAILTTPGRLERLAQPTAERISELVGDMERDPRGEPITIARLVATLNATVAKAHPVLEESAQTVRAVRPVLSEARKTVAEARKTVAAARPALKAVRGALERAAPVLEGIRGDLKPTLEASRSLIADAQASLDDIYPDIRSAVQTAEVGMRSGSEVAGHVEKVAPTVTQNVAAISTDTRRIVHRAASPWTWVWGGVKKVLSIIF